MLLVQESREPLSEAIVAGSCFVEQKLLRLARKISPTPHNGETQRIFEVVLVVGIHFSCPEVKGKQRSHRFR